MIRPTVVRPAMHDDNILVDSIFLPLNLEQESCRNNLQDRCLGMYSVYTTSVRFSLN